MSKNAVTRRSFVAGSAALALVPAGEAPPPRQATGTRVGEVTASPAVVWTRLTAHPTRNSDKLEGACPGATGQVRLRYGTREDLSDAAVTAWFDVTEEGDCIHHFRLKGLRPGTVYHYASETAGPGGKPAHGPFRGRFQTAPAEDAVTDLRFCVMTCQGYPDRGHQDGHPIYPSMLGLEPAFAAFTGDLVYYDNDEPRAVTPRLARYHWERMFSLPRLVEFNRSVAAYWLKDDHDTLDNDSWPGKKMGEL